MELSPKQQFIDQVSKSKTPLILTHERPDGDALGSLLALTMTLKKMGKEVSAVCVDPIPAVFQFLPSISEISQEFTGTRDFIVTIEADQIQPDKIVYKLEDNKLNIVITPKHGQFKSEMVSFKDGGFKFDLIIVLDSTDPDRLGISFEANPDLFFETPVINIDHHAGNDYFGKVNIVDLTATSTSEILVSLIEALGQKFDEDTATALLTGITTDTGSFQNANTTPKSLTIAAQLVAAGGRQQEIIKNIYKTRTLTTLKLWGLALSKMQLEAGHRFIWSALSKSDFDSVGAIEDEASGVIDELLKTASGMDFALLITERGDGLHGSLRSIAKGVDVSAIASLFGGGGHVAASAFQLAGTSLAESLEMVLNRIREYLGQSVVDRLNGHNQDVRETLVAPQAIEPRNLRTQEPKTNEDSNIISEPITTTPEPVVTETVQPEIPESASDESNEPTPKW